MTETKVEMKLSKKQIDILKHSLGLGRKKKPYRNYFLAEEGHSDWNDLQDLVKQGAMISKTAPSWTTGTYFFVTPEGAKFLDVELPK